MAGLTSDPEPTTRHGVSLLVLGIVVLSLIVQRLVEGSNQVSPLLSSPVPTSPATLAAAAPSPTAAPPTALPSPTDQTAPAVPSPTQPPTTLPSPTAPPPSPTPTRPPPSPTSTPPLATPIPPTATPVPPTPVPPTATRPPQPAPPPAAKPSGRTVRVVRDEQSKPALVRAQPSVRALVIGDIPPDTVVQVLGEQRGDAVSGANNLWYRVSWSGQTGYVFSGLVAPT